jgi:hypothetical protein
MPTYTLTGAYGRDYTSRAAALADWNAGKDFRVYGSGPVVNKADADAAGLTVRIRYDRLTRCTADILPGK